VDIEEGTKSPLHAEQPLGDTRQPTPPAVPEEDPFAVDEPIGTDFDLWRTADDNPGLTANPEPVPPESHSSITDNHLSGDGGPSEPVWMAFGGRPPATSSIPAQEIPMIPIDPDLLATTPSVRSITLSSNRSSATPPQPSPYTRTLTPNVSPPRIEPPAAESPTAASDALPTPASAQVTPSLANEIPSHIETPAAGFTLPTRSSTPSITDSLPPSHVELPSAAPLPQADEVASISGIDNVQTRPYTAPRKQPTPAEPSASGRGRGGRGRGKGKGKGSGGKRGGRQGGGLKVGGEGGDPNDENVPAGDPDVVQIHPLTAAQRREIANYNKMLQNVTPNLDGMYPLANFGPPPSSSVPILSKRPRKAATLGDGSAAYLAPSAEDLEKAEEIRRQKAAQRALKRAGNAANPGRVAKRYVVRSTVEFSLLTFDLYSAKKN